MANIGRRLPKDFMVTSTGSEHSVIAISATLETTDHADALVEAIQLLRGQLTSFREGVAADIGIDEPQPPTFAEQLQSAGLAPPPQEGPI